MSLFVSQISHASPRTCPITDDAARSHARRRRCPRDRACRSVAGCSAPDATHHHRWASYPSHRTRARERALVSLTQWTPARFPQRKARGRSGAGAEDTDAVIDAARYDVVTRDPAGTIIAPAPGYDWPAPMNGQYGSYTLTYESGWTVTPESAPLAGDGVNEVPAIVRLMVERAVQFRAGSAGLGRYRDRIVKARSSRLLQNRPKLPAGNRRYRARLRSTVRASSRLGRDASPCCDTRSGKPLG